jgi:hypothetical protein
METIAVKRIAPRAMIAIGLLFLLNCSFVHVTEFIGKLKIIIIIIIIQDYVTWNFGESHSFL